MRDKIQITVWLVVGTLFSTGAAMAIPQELTHLKGTLDGEMVQMAQAFPGFGGFFYDAQGTPKVWLKDLVTAPLFMAMYPDAKVLHGKYDYLELTEWRGRLRSLLSGEGVVFLDIDETQNRVALGIDAKNAASVKDWLDLEVQKLDVPADALYVEATDPIVPVATLQSKFRPAPAGVQINFSSSACTLGINAFRSGVFGFLTNSHCTNVQGGVESTRYYQPDVAGGAVATEIADPAYSTAFPCPSGRRCRWSDSSFARYDTSSLGEYRKIARTVSRSTGTGSLTVSSSFPRLTVIGKTLYPVAGENLDKVGRTTGWTFGLVNSTCVDTNVAGTNITLYCQSRVNAAVASGDSGSPVFKYIITNGTAAFYGLLWGSSGGTQFVMSPLGNIERELGTITVH